MYPFEKPLKVHFVSDSGSDLAVVFVDFLEFTREGIHFHLGRRQVALLRLDVLRIGPRRIDRSQMHRIKPFWFEEELQDFSQTPQRFH